MASSKLREAVREELRRRNGGGGKPDKGPGDLVRADREAGRNIQRDTDTWTVATPEEFRQGMKVAPSKGPESRPSRHSGSTRENSGGYDTGGEFVDIDGEGEETRDAIRREYIRRKNKRGGGRR